MSVSSGERERNISEKIKFSNHDNFTLGKDESNINRLNLDKNYQFSVGILKII